MSTSKRLKELHENGEYCDGKSLMDNLIGRHNASAEAWELLPEIATVIAAAEWAEAEMRDRFDLHGSGASVSLDELRDTLAALASKLGVDA